MRQPAANASTFPSRHVPVRASAADSWYHQDAVRPFLVQPPLETGRTVDVVVVGAGFTGVSAALDLAEAGLSVVVLEAGLIGAGASGRNGGLVCSGWRQDQPWFEDRLGQEAAGQLWALAETAKTDMAERLVRYGIDAHFERGLLFAAHNPAMMDWLDTDAAHLASRYGYHSQTRLSAAECADALGTGVFHGGWRDDGAGRVQPLRLLYGLAGAAKAAGAVFHEATKAIAVVAGAAGVRVETATATGAGPALMAGQVLLCGDGYLDGISPMVERRVMPIGSFVVATEPLDPALGIMAGAVGAMDTRFVVNYFQRTADSRLIFGGGEKYTPSWPNDIARFVRGNLEAVFPALSGVTLTHAWGGSLGITPTRLPWLTQVAPGILSASGYSGQGVLLAPYFGRLLAKAVITQEGVADVLGSLPVPPFPGGRMLRWPLLSAAMSWFALRDRLGL